MNTVKGGHHYDQIPRDPSRFFFFQKVRDTKPFQQIVHSPSLVFPSRFHELDYTLSHFRVVCGCVLLVFHGKIIPQNSLKSQCFRHISALEDAQTGHRLVRLWLLGLQSFHQPAVLLGCQLPHLVFVSRPLERSVFQPFIQQEKFVSFPVQPPDPVLPSAAEQEQHSLKGVQLKLRLHHAGQSVDSPAQIRVSACKVNGAAAVEIVQHDFTAWSSACSVALSAPS